MIKSWIRHWMGPSMDPSGTPNSTGGGADVEADCCSSDVLHAEESETTQSSNYSLVDTIRRQQCD
jgi:hypothetical protein